MMERKEIYGNLLKDFLFNISSSFDLLLKINNIVKYYIMIQLLIYKHLIISLDRTTNF